MHLPNKSKINFFVDYVGHRINSFLFPNPFHMYLRVTGCSKCISNQPDACSANEDDAQGANAFGKVADIDIHFREIFHIHGKPISILTVRRKT